MPLPSRAKLSLSCFILVTVWNANAGADQPFLGGKTVGDESQAHFTVEIDGRDVKPVSAAGTDGRFVRVAIADPADLPTTRTDAFADADAAAKRREFATQERILRSLAKAGNAEAQDQLARAVQHKSSGSQWVPEARYWFEKAALQGQGDAQRMLGVIYWDGQGVRQDYRQAYSWFLKGAEDSDDEESKGDLSQMYLEGGPDFPPDAREACFWSEVGSEGIMVIQSNEEGDDGNRLARAIDGAQIGDMTSEAQAQGLAAAIYGMVTSSDGRRIRTLVEAKGPPNTPSRPVIEQGPWGWVSSSYNPDDHVAAASWLSEKCAAVAPNLTSAVIDEIERRAADWRARHPSSGALVAGPSGPFQKAVLADRLGDHGTALRYFLAVGNPESHALPGRLKAKAQTNLGIMFENGLGVARDDAAALTWYRRAAASGEPMEAERAQVHIGQMYEAGKGVPVDLVQAYTWYAVASEYPPSFYSGQWFLAGDEARNRLAPKLTSEQIGSAIRQALVTLEDHAARERGVQAMVKLRDHYARGWDWTQACFWQELITDRDGEGKVPCAYSKATADELKAAHRLAAGWRAAHREIR